MSADHECPTCGRGCAEGDCVAFFTPIPDCTFKDDADGCCRHSGNITPECHVDACPRLHPRLRAIYDRHFLPRSASAPNTPGDDAITS